MIWSWTPIVVEPADILSAMETLNGETSWYQAEIVADWTPSGTYLAWRKSALRRSLPLDSMLLSATRRGQSVDRSTHLL